MNDALPPLYRLYDERSCICSNVHNVTGAKGRAGAHSRYPRLQPGETLTLAEFEGPAVITRFWLTFDWPATHAYRESVRRNRLVSLEITWDDAATPAVRAPVGDFFCHPLGYDIPFENACFASPAGRSLLGFLPMPFRKKACIRLVSAFDKPVSVFHDIRLATGIEPHEDDGYLHACFNRTQAAEPGLTHPILPPVQGRGRYLGMHLGVITDRFNPLHWHGACPRIYLDGDEAHPSVMGASLDDFGGASWAYDKRYMHRDSGLLLARHFPLGGGHFGFYFYHRRDPFHFVASCAVTIRPEVGMTSAALLALLRENPGIAGRLALPPYSAEELEQRVQAGHDDWFDCGRMDDFSSVAFFYLDSPEGTYAPCAPDLAMAPANNWPPSDAHLLLED